MALESMSLDHSMNPIKLKHMTSSTLYITPMSEQMTEKTYTNE